MKTTLKKREKKLQTQTTCCQCVVIVSHRQWNNSSGSERRGVHVSADRTNSTRSPGLAKGTSQNFDWTPKQTNQNKQQTHKNQTTWECFALGKFDSRNSRNSLAFSGTDSCTSADRQDDKPSLLRPKLFPMQMLQKRPLNQDEPSIVDSFH